MQAANHLLVPLFQARWTIHQSVFIDLSMVTLKMMMMMMMMYERSKYVQDVIL
jgi:hypothetical protein